MPICSHYFRKSACAVKTANMRWLIHSAVSGVALALLVPIALGANIPKLARECDGNNLKACDELRNIAENPRGRTSERVDAIRSLHSQQVLTDIAKITEGELRTAANDRLNEILQPDFLRAIAAGNVDEIKAVAAKGVKIDPHSPALEIEGVQRVSGAFRYKVKYEDRAASPPLLTAIRSGRADSIRTLVSLGADIKNEVILESARLGIENASPVPIQVIENTVRLGFSTNLNWQNAFFHLNAGVVDSSFQPTPATKGTYLSLAKQLLTTEQDSNRRGNLQKVVDFLAENAGVK
jgi:hypothetical protein